MKNKDINTDYSLDVEHIDNCINNITDKNYAIRYNKYLYYYKTFKHENNIGNFLKYINADHPYLECLLKNAESFLDDYNGIKLNQEQKESFLSVFKSNVNITVGPAGTGKSEILTRLCKFIEKEKSCLDVAILFLTPTGKACDRLSKGFKNKGIEKSAFTIHKYNYYNNDNNYTTEYKIEDFEKIMNNDYKIIVIDEMSMIGLNIFGEFIAKINNFRRVILLLLGDTNQLPSIDCGDILNHLVLSNSFNVVELKTIFRSESKSLLVAQNNILKYNNLLTDMPLDDDSFKWIKENPLNTEIIEKVINDFEDLPLIITSTNKVVDEYQNIIKDKYNINWKDKPNVLVSKKIFHTDDNIIIKKNDYEKHLMNGMVGKIISFNNKIISVDSSKKKEIVGLNILFEGEDEVRNTIFPEDYITSDSPSIIDLAYIITIHKSQGSESDNVIILMDQAPMLNTINLLYTAITRAKKKCILIAEESTINTIISEKRKTKRISNLKDFC